jgi:2-C-methyl-D-erythritol 4-phosphate cytidylyltransferase
VTVGVVIPAGGKGLRLGEPLPKQFLEVEPGWPLLRYSLETFHGMPEVVSIVLVLPGEWLEQYASWTVRYPKLSLAPGGSERWLSVRQGYRALPSFCDSILIHDAARPFVTATQIRSCLERLRQGVNCTLAQPCVDTIKRVSGAAIKETLDRNTLIAVQTPQGFSRRSLEAMYSHAETMVGAVPTDECMLAEAAGLAVEWVAGGENARKVTQAEDFRWACEMAARLKVSALPS